MYILLISILYKNANMMNKLRASVEENVNTRLIDNISQIRDGFVKLFQLSRHIRFMKPFRRALENVAIDWDDFTEDCVIVSDSEIKDLLTRVNNAI